MHAPGAGGDEADAGDALKCATKLGDGSANNIDSAGASAGDLLALQLAPQLRLAPQTTIEALEMVTVTVNRVR